MTTAFLVQYIDEPADDSLSYRANLYHGHMGVMFSIETDICIKCGKVVYVVYVVA